MRVEWLIIIFVICTLIYYLILQRYFNVISRHLYEIRFLALRFFTVYGPSQRPDLGIHKFFKSILDNDPIPVFGDGSTSRDYTYIDDLVQGIIAAITYTGSDYEIINLGNNQKVLLKDLIKTIEDICNRKAIIERLPIQQGDVNTTYADISKAKYLLNYDPQTRLKEGLTSFYKWYIENFSKI